ncbi:MAG: acyl carrier protein [Actinocatenispora sp.]
MTVPDEEQFRTVFRQVLRLREDFELDRSFLALGLNSLDLIRLLERLEDTFDLDLPDDALGLDNSATPRDLWHSIRQMSAPDQPSRPG